MLSFNYKNKEDFIEEIYNGNFQDAIYEYLRDKEAELIYFKKTNASCYNNDDVTEKNIFDYFECTIGNRIMYSKNLANPSSPEEHLINIIIQSVFKRFNKFKDQIQEAAKRKMNDEIVVDTMVKCSIRYVVSSEKLNFKEQQKIIENVKDFQSRYTRNYY